MRLNRLVSLSALLVSFAARAQDGVGDPKATVEKNLVKPLAQRDNERSRFSRAAEPPDERRVRLLEPAQQLDARGLSFRTFAIDARYEDEKWTQNTILGCIYLQDGSIYVKRGDAYRAAAMLLGKKTEAPPEGVCRAKPGNS